MRHRVITESIAQPAAGADWSFIPSSTDKVLILAVTGKFVTSATAANRRPGIAVKAQDAGYIWSQDAGYPQVASMTTFYSWARGAAGVVDTTLAASERIALPFPWMRLQPGDTLCSITSLIDAADQWSALAWRGIVGDWWEREHELAELAEAFAVAAAG